MYERERKGIQIPNAYLCEINVNAYIIFTIQSLKIMLQNNFKDSKILCTYIGDDPTPEIEFWFYKTVYIYFKYKIIDLFVHLLVVCLCPPVCMHTCVKVYTCHRNLKKLVFSTYHVSLQDGTQVKPGDRPGTFIHQSTSPV